VRSNFGMTLYTSNNDCARASLDANLASGCYAATHPTNNAAEAQMLLRMGEVDYDRRRTADALAWIRGHPARFARLTLERIRQFWFPEPSAPLYTVWATWAVTILSIPGLFLLARSGRGRLVLLIVAIWAIYPALYYIVVSGMRYRYPILWTSLLPAGYAAAAAARRRGRRPA
jgi:hypothetical protein